MPAFVAHYQFGQDTLDRLDSDIRSKVLAHKPEYDIGLQGPDIFYYHRPYMKNRISDYGLQRHHQPANRMFAPIFAQVRKRASLSYMFGLICHYALDRRCHPYVNGHSRSIVGHLEMESAFDRHIMSCHALTKKRFHYIPATGLDYESMASLWPGMTEHTVRKCVKKERGYAWLLDQKRLMSFLETVIFKRGEYSPIALPRRVSGVQEEHVRSLDRLYDKALSECPGLIRKSMELMGAKEFSCPEFDLDFAGAGAKE